MIEDQGPIHLEEDPATGDRFLVYGTAKGMRLDIRFEGETLWMTQAQIAQLFGRDTGTISRHISNILQEGELDEESSLQKTQRTVGRPATLYSLDMVISVGYRVSSSQATLFRRWATGVLVQYAKKGFVVDAPRLKEPGASDRIAELKEIIRDLRSDEANVYRELRKICAMCQDYDGTEASATTFYQHMQAKLVHAVVSMTPAEVIHSRVDHQQPNMGLETWPNDNIRKSDVTVSKNYLAEREIRELNRLTTILLDIFEDQADLGRLIVMNDAKTLLDRQLAQLGRSILRGGGSVSKNAADEKAKSEYGHWKAAQKKLRHAQADESISELAAASRKLPRSPR